MADHRALPRWARWTAAGCGAAVIAAGTYLVADAVPSGAATTGLRTATVATGSVTQSIDLSGSVERVDQVTAAFRTAGTVTSVKVEVGDEVEAGDALATIGTAGLERAVTVAQADLVAAQAALDADDGSSSTTSAASSSSSTSSGGGSGSTPSASTGASGSGSGSTPSPSSSGAPARGVDTSGVHRAVDDFDALVQAAVTTCRPVTDPGSDSDPTPTPSGSAPPTPTPSPTPSESPSTGPSQSPVPTATAATASSGDLAVEPASLATGDTTSPTPEEVSACVQALSSALASAQHTASAMKDLTTALDAAAKALQEQQSTTASQGSTGQGGAATGTGGGGTGTTSGTAGPGGAGGGGQSSASLEVAVLQATQELAAAEQDLDAAVLEAPISGTVGQLDLVTGEQAGTTSGVVIVGPGAAVVTVDLPLAQLDRVRVGQEVTVTPAGTTDEVPGLVQSIGVLPSSTTTSTPTYPVRITVSDAPVTLASGSTATASIPLATATDVLTVPVSAVTGVSSGRGSVQVLSNGTTTPTTVTVGAVGQGRAQVEEGLTAGQVVVLADPSTALPSSNSTGPTRRSSTTGVGGLTGSGGGGGGFGGPPGG